MRKIYTSNIRIASRCIKNTIPTSELLQNMRKKKNQPIPRSWEAWDNPNPIIRIASIDNHLILARCKSWTLTQPLNMTPPATLSRWAATRRPSWWIMALPPLTAALPRSPHPHLLSVRAATPSPEHSALWFRFLIRTHLAQKYASNLIIRTIWNQE